MEEMVVVQLQSSPHWRTQCAALRNHITYSEPTEYPVASIYEGMGKRSFPRIFYVALY